MGTYFQFHDQARKIPDFYVKLSLYLVYETNVISNQSVYNYTGNKQIPKSPKTQLTLQHNTIDINELVVAR